MNPQGGRTGLELTGVDLARLIRGTREHYPISDAYEAAPGPGRGTWYSSQKEHIVGWLGELDGPGAYDRKSRGLGAKHFYNHFQCAPGLLWLAEALGEDPAVVQRAADAAGNVGRYATQCAAIRRVIPWARIEELIGHARRRRVSRDIRSARPNRSGRAAGSR